MNKVILTSNSYYPSIGGIENSLRHLAQEAVKLGLNPTIVAGDSGIGVPLKQVNREVIDGIPVIRYPLKPIQIPILRWFNLLVSCFICWRVYRDLFAVSPHSVVVARFHFNALLSVWTGFKQTRYLVPSIVQQQSGVEIYNASFNKRWIGRIKIGLHNVVQKAALRRCCNFVFSETMRSQCVSLAKNDLDDYHLVKPGVDGKRFHPIADDERKSLRMEFGFSANDRVVLFVGRFVKAKGVDLVLRALHLANDNTLKLIMVGEGAEEDNYRKLIDELDLQTQVCIASPTSKVEAYYQVADVFVMSSCYEPLGQTILEAFASGLVVAAFKNSKFVNTATEELGMDNFVVYAEDYSAVSLLRSLRKILVTDYDEKYKIHEFAVNNFSWQKLLDGLLVGRAR